MRRSDCDRLRDMLEAAHNAQTFLGGATVAELAGDLLRLSAVTDQLAVLGEAAGGVSAAVTEQPNRVPWRQMRDLRNFVIHEYSRVDVKIIHSVVVQNLPEVVTELATLLKGCPDEST